MVRDGMDKKVRLLSKLSHPFVMAPQGVVENEKGQPIGIYMPFAEGEPLPKVFTNAFRGRASFGDKEAAQLVGHMRDTVAFAHSASAIMVDANELNWLAAMNGKHGPEPRIIDVDSWAIGNFPATAIMPSIRDWHTKGFTPASDWFAWGVVTFQIFTGIHPYRGTLDGYKPGDTEARMKANASVFNKKVRLNQAVRGFGTIPASLRGWYEAVFEKGERTAPPSPLQAGGVAVAARTMRVVQGPHGALSLEKLFERSGDPVIRIFHCGVALLQSKALIDLRSKRQIGNARALDAEVVAVEAGWLIADRENGTAVFTYVDDRTLEATPLALALAALRFLRHEDRLFAVMEGELIELKLLLVGKPILSVGRRTHLLTPKSIKWFDGVGIQEAFGATFMIVPLGDDAMITIRTPELDALVPVSAKAGGRFVSVVGLDRSRSYRSFDLTFSADLRSYTVSAAAVDGPDLNVAILPKGVCATIPDDGTLSIFVPLNGQKRDVSDKAITADMELASWKDTVVYQRGGAAWKMQLR
jgi:hypothetical protein